VRCLGFLLLRLSKLPQQRRQRRLLSGARAKQRRQEARGLAARLRRAILLHQAVQKRGGAQRFAGADRQIALAQIHE
jgi:hypothetical protein